MKLVRAIVIFTVLSIALGFASSRSPAIAGLGWLLGTAISVAGGAFFGRTAAAVGPAAIGGAIVGGASIAIGCALAFIAGAMPLSGVLAATAVGVASGAIAGAAARKLAR